MRRGYNEASSRRVADGVAYVLSDTQERGNEMENENGTVSTQAPLYGLLAIPVTIAIMLAMMIAATWNTVDYDDSNWNTLLMITTVLLAGGLLGKAPRIIFEPVGTRPSLVSLGFAVVIGAVGLLHYYDGAALLGLGFVMMAIGVHLFDRCLLYTSDAADE